MEKYRFSDEQRSLLEHIQVPFAVYQFINKRVVTLALSDGFCKLFGYTDRTQAYYDMDNDMYKDTHPDDVVRITNAAFRFATGKENRFNIVYRTKKPGSDAYTVVHATGEHIFTDEGIRLAHVWYTDEGAYVQDTALEEQTVSETLSGVIHAQSMLKGNPYDDLTGLPNMTFFFEMAYPLRDAVLGRGGLPAFLYIDFNGMQFFNSKHGFAQGDRILKAFAKLMVETFGGEFCCRIGADHFAAIADETGLEDKLNRIFSTFGKLYRGQTPPIHVGIYPNRMGKLSASAACDRAKMACAALRGSYSSGFRFFSDDLLEQAMLKQYVIENIDTAIRKKWLRVYYQPIIRSVNEKICNAEALARWIDPVKGFMSPASFIPTLEDAKLIYKLDLYVLEQVLENMQSLKAKGYDLIPHSINLSRSDFDACDIVEEVRKRVDASGIDRDKITIEVTESAVGSNFEYMKEQVARFRSLGFPVWMDDFGSGYSSLDVLQSIRFDLLKFDMNFMQKFDENENGKIILTELMKMATAMGVETICEGAETKAQVRFLREIGCSKIQGFYFGKPMPFPHVFEWYETHKDTDLENPAEVDYYEAIGRINLYDLGVIAMEDINSFHNAFDTLPMGIIEVSGSRARFVRANPTYRDFIKRFIGVDLSIDGSALAEFDAPFMNNVVKTCCEQGLRLFYDEKMADGSVVHSFARRISINPINGNVAVLVAVISISEPDESTTYADIARALAADYYNIYIVDLDTDRYIEYRSHVGGEDLVVERHGKDFFESAKHDAETRIFEQDREIFFAWFSKENIIRELDAQGAFTSTYRLIDNGTPMFVSMKITKMQPDGRRIILGISIVEAYMRQKEHLEQLQKEREMMVRIMALSDGYLSLYTVDLNTDHYVEYSSSELIDSLGISKQGEQFFRQTTDMSKLHFHPDDRQRFAEQFTKENVLREIRENGKFKIQYHLLINGEPRPVILKAALFRDGEEDKMVVGVREQIPNEPDNDEG